VYVVGGGLLYIGQTGDAKRRLRDLPVGESHHLATTVPPETWERVVVVQWPVLLASTSPQQALVAERLGLPTCGLAMEHLLQVAYMPVMTARRRSTRGGWNMRQPALSNSRGAASSVQFAELFEAVRVAWDTLAMAASPADGEPIAHTDVGRVVFPQALPVQT
jgi:hypothetical protein